MASIKPAKLSFKVVEPTTKSSKGDLIFIHGTSGTKDNFDDIINEIANKTGRKIYALDMRNHGDSERSEIFSFEAMTADVLHFMDEHNIKTATILGHSMGGRLALFMSLAHPDRIDSIIVEDMTPKAVPVHVIKGYAILMRRFHEAIDQVPADADMKTASTAILKHVLENKPEDVLTNMKMTEGKRFPLAIEKKDGKYVWKANFPVIRREMLNLKYTEDLTGLYKKPALFLYGNNSEFNVGNDTDFILKLFPQAQLNGLPTSHMVHSECTDEFIEAVVKFLE